MPTRKRGDARRLGATRHFLVARQQRDAMSAARCDKVLHSSVCLAGTWVLHAASSQTEQQRTPTLKIGDSHSHRTAPRQIAHPFPIHYHVMLENGGACLAISCVRAPPFEQTNGKARSSPSLPSRAATTSALSFRTPRSSRPLGPPTGTGRGSRALPIYGTSVLLGKGRYVLRRDHRAFHTYEACFCVADERVRLTALLHLASRQTDTSR